MTTTPTPRPVQSPEDRMRDARTDATGRTFATYLDRTERDQLDAKAATAEQERDDALQDRDEARASLRDAMAELRDRTRQRDEARRDRDDYREARDVLRQQRDRTLADLTDAGNEVDQLTVDNARLRAELGAAQELADFRQGVNDSLRQDLSDAGDVIAAVREAAERLDRVLAGRLPSLPDIRAAVEHIDRALAAYDAPGDTRPPLGSLPPRAQDEPDSDARRLLDQAIGTALPLAGGRVTELLDALRRELARVDAKRAEREG